MLSRIPSGWLQKTEREISARGQFPVVAFGAVGITANNGSYSTLIAHHC